MNSKFNKIVLSGEGGQGIQTIANILTLVVSNSDKNVCYLPQFGPEQRGTPSVAFIQISEKEIYSAKFYKSDLLVVLRERALPHIEKYIQKETVILFDSSTIDYHLIKQSENKKIAIPATKISKHNLKGRNVNLIIAGFLCKLLSLDEKDFLDIIKTQLAKKIKNEYDKELIEQSFYFGYNFEAEKKKFSKPEYRTSASIVLCKNDQKEAIISPELCKGCGICIEKCPTKALKFGSNVGVYGNSVPEIDLNKCIVCGNCFRYCPDCAIKVKKNK